MVPKNKKPEKLVKQNEEEEKTREPNVNTKASRVVST